ncbi:uncharacterized protein LOC116146820 isoform X1 [Pistacia vera]|uniref:uncharacterized protein LOC116146820 isoform X1 n=1 Tax=Pistacia vera TaxID=55513 RepID=UPI0012636ECA|nr:uncharacterized protein LOC116146820 isoform X1 [Pistacia vera]
MMQSRLAATAKRSCWVFSAANNQVLQRKFLVAAASSGRTADPAIHSGELEAGPDVHTGEPQQGADNVTAAEPARHKLASEHKPSSDVIETEPLVTPKPPHISSPRLESTGLKQPLNPQVQQKRRNSTNVALEDVICIGVDGTPLKEDQEKEQRDEREKTLDEKEYFSNHKASPLSEIKIADTRKPITRATDGTADARADYGAGRDVIGWKPEQLDTAEESLRRATEIWKQNAMRGDPDVFPHSRVLRELRGEWF